MWLEVRLISRVGDDAEKAAVGGQDRQVRVLQDFLCPPR